MTKLFERLVERALLLAAVFAGILVFHNATRGAVEPPCANSTCFNVKYYCICSNRKCQTGESLQAYDCIPCTTGRCSPGGNPINCTQTINPQGIQAVNVSEYCFCNAAPANANVQANGDWTGPWKASSVKEYLCP